MLVLTQHKQGSTVAPATTTRVKRAAVIVVGALLATLVGGARADAPGPLPCGLPQTAPLWVDYADGMVPFWSTIFARPGIVGAASNFIVPPQLRAKGAKTVYFDLYLNNRVGTPSKPADPTTIQGRADKLFDTFRRELLRPADAEKMSALVPRLCRDAKIMRSFDSFPVGSPEEQDRINQILGLPSGTNSAVGSLLLGPIVRGTTVVMP